MIDIRDLRIGSHVALNRYPNRVCRIECIMPTSVYISYVYISYADNGVRVKMFNVPITELKPLEITEERLNALCKATGIPKERFKVNAEWHILETFAWVEFRKEIIAE